MPAPIILTVAPAPSPAFIPAPADTRWRAAYLLLAPHRLGFFLAMLVLVASALWWAGVQLGRAGLMAMPLATLSPTVVHGAVMALGFIPLFFSGFLFTAGPKWLGVRPHAARTVAPAQIALALGWLLWLAGALLHPGLALAGLVCATLGLAGMVALWVQLIRRSAAADQLHARTVAVACAVGVCCLAVLAAALALGEGVVLARVAVLTALWGCVTVVYVVVAHRMIPFFTSGVLPGIPIWRPLWVLWLMVGAAAFEVMAVWLDAYGPTQATPWLVLRGALELTAGGVLLWLAVVWGVAQSFTNKLLAMLHVGFVWLGLALALSGAAQWASAWQGAAVLPLGALHALSMGCLGSLMLAMVTRVSCGHSGRALVADRLVWGLFCALQAATVLRIVAAASAQPWLLALAALAWAAIMLVWAMRLAGWYGRLRADGREG